MAKPVEQITVPITVALKPEVVQKLQENAKSDLATTLSTWAAWFLSQYACGGMMLQHQHMEQLRALAGDSPLTEAIHVVKLASKGLNRDDGQYSIRVDIDPALIGPLEQHAKEIGWTVQEIMTEVSNVALVNSWAQEFQPDGGIFSASDHDRRIVAQVLGKTQFTFHDIAELVQKLAKSVIESKKTAEV